MCGQCATSCGAELAPHVCLPRDQSEDTGMTLHVVPSDDRRTDSDPGAWTDVGHEEGPEPESCDCFAGCDDPMCPLT